MKYVMMPVSCIDEFCTNCPDIELKTETTVNHYYNGVGNEHVEYSNSIYCAKRHRCEGIAAYLNGSERHAAEDSEQYDE